MCASIGHPGYGILKSQVSNGLGSEYGSGSGFSVVPGSEFGFQIHPVQNKLKPPPDPTKSGSAILQIK
jgi:hypothetical protein